MVLKFNILAAISILILACSCNTGKKEPLVVQVKKVKSVAKGNHTVIIIPFSGTDSNLVKQIRKGLESHLSTTITIGPVSPLPIYAYYKPRSRYIADSLLVFLNHNYAVKAEKIIGITEKDISTRKEDIENWGVLGLGSCPGTSCVVSSFRAGRYKVSPAVFLQRMTVLALHELGHTYGLPHCPEATCIMKDAGGKMNLDDGNSFCKACRGILNNKGILQ